MLLSIEGVYFDKIRFTGMKINLRLTKILIQKKRIRVSQCV